MFARKFVQNVSFLTYIAVNIMYFAGILFARKIVQNVNRLENEAQREETKRGLKTDLGDRITVMI